MCVAPLLWLPLLHIHISATIGRLSENGLKPDYSAEQPFISYRNRSAKSSARPAAGMV